MPRGGRTRPEIKDERLITALLTGCTLPEAARRTGESLSAIKRRNTDPGFQRKLMEHQASMIERVKRSITDKAIDAADALWQIATDLDGAAGRDGATQRSIAAGRLLSSFVQLQPKQTDDPFDGGTSTPVVYCVLEGVDAEVLR